MLLTTDGPGGVARRRPPAPAPASGRTAAPRRDRRPSPRATDATRLRCARPRAAGRAVRPRRLRRCSTPAGSGSSAPATPPPPVGTTAFELGEALAGDGVAVVSGLARGIDGAAHRGVLGVDGGRAVAVVGSGPRRPYPQQNADLWEWCADNGLLLSEWPPGTRARAWRFPLRNRIIAALSEVLVVVESRESGGWLITAAGGGRAVRRRDGGSRLRPEPGRRRHQPAARRWRSAGDVRRRRAASRSASTRRRAGGGGVRPSAAARGRRPRRCSSAVGAAVARSTRSSCDSTCRSPRRRCRSPASSAGGWVHRHRRLVRAGGVVVGHRERASVRSRRRRARPRAVDAHTGRGRERIPSVRSPWPRASAAARRSVAASSLRRAR